MYKRKRKYTAAALILSHNCGDMLEKAIQKCLVLDFDMIIITDDGSIDKSLSILDNYPDIKLTKTTKKGYGANLKNGLDYGRKLDIDYIIEVHGDGAQFDPKSFIDADVKLTQGVDLIVGSRLINLKRSKELGYPFIRMYGNIILCFFYKLLIHVPNSEFHVGFHIYSRKILEADLSNLSDNYLFPVEIVCYAKFKNFIIDEIPVECSYLESHTSHNLLGALWVSVKAFYVIFIYHLANLKLKIGYLKNE